MTGARRRAPLAACTAAVALVLIPADEPIRGQTAPVLSAAAREARALERLHALLVSRRGELLLEHYAPGTDRADLANIKSASKSLVTLLVGIALDRGLLGSVREPIATYLPHLRQGPAAKRAIVLEDLLTMRSGLESTSGPGYGPWVRSRHWVRYVLDRPLVSEPGTTMEYSTGTSHLLSAILTRATGKSTWAFAQEVLARPLRISLARWTRDPQGIYLGGNEMRMTPRQMLAVGEMVVRGGVADGRRIVSADWIAESCRPRTRSRWDPTREYGYGWWIQDVAATARALRGDTAASTSSPSPTSTSWWSSRRRRMPARIGTGIGTAC